MFQSQYRRGILNLRLAAAWLLLGLGASAVLAAAPDAEDLVYESLDAQLENYGLYVQQRMTSYGTMHLIFTNDPRRGVFVNVVYPTIPAGITSHDSKTTLKTYYPRDNVVKIQTSPTKFRPNSRDRFRLILRNYTPKVISEKEAIAERPVYTVLLTAKHKEAGSRFLYLDKEKKVPLKHTLIMPDGEHRVLVNTLKVDYEPSSRPQSFDIGAPEDARVERVWGPERFTSVKTAAKEVGFEPSLPSRLPYGFVIEDKQLVGQKEMPFVGIRISDGMWSMTVYQWSNKVFGGKSPPNLVAQEFDPIGVSYALESEAPTSLGRDILKFFRLR